MPDNSYQMPDGSTYVVPAELDEERAKDVVLQMWKEEQQARQATQNAPDSSTQQVSTEPTRSTAENIAEGAGMLGGTTAGALAGAEGGAALGAPLGPLGAAAGGFAGGVAGAAGGGAAVRGTLDLLRQKLLPGEPQQSPTELLQSAGQEGLKQGAYEAIGQTVFGALTKAGSAAFNKFGPKLKPAANGVTNFLQQQAAKLGIKTPSLLPAEKADSWFLNSLHNIVGSSVTSGGIFKAYKQNRDKLMGQIADGLLQDFATKTQSKEELGQLVVDTINGRRSLHKEATDFLYNKVDNIVNQTGERVAGRLGRAPIEQVEVPTGILDSLGNPITRTETLLGPERVIAGARVQTRGIKNSPEVRRLRAVASELESLGDKDFGTQFIAKLDNLPDELSYDAAKKFRTDVINFQKAAQRATGVSGIAQRESNIITDKMSDSIFNGLKNFNPEAARLWKVATEYARSGKEQFDNVLIKRLTKYATENGEGASMVAKSVFSPDNLTTIKRVKEAMGYENWPVMEQAFMKNMLEESTQDGVIQGQHLLNNLGKYKDVLGEVVTKEQQRNLDMLGKALQMQQEKGEGTFKVFIELSQAAAIGGLLKFGLAPEAGIILGGPWLVAKAMLNPTTAKLMVEGLRTPPGSAKFAGITSRFTGAMIDMVQREQREAEKRSRKEVLGIGTQ